MNYADTNWLEAIYIGPKDLESERRREIVERFMRRHSGPLALSHIVLLEARNVFRRTTGERNPAEWTLLESDFDIRLYVDPMNWDLLRRECYVLFDKYAWKAPIGTFDTAIVASAKLAGATQFLSFDARAKALATAEGMAVFPPLNAGEKQITAKLRS